MSKGLYIHIPFCKYICSYCDFGKKYIKNQPVDEYVNSLVKELEMYKPFTDVNSIYIGGGTPSSLKPQQLQIIFDKLNELIDFEQIVEYSFEMNPDDVTVEFLQFLKTNKINRISIGAQTLNDDILSNLRRKHSGQDVRNAVAIATKIFTNVSVDFMFNLPNQTQADIDQSISFIANSNLQHVSYYGLIFEEHTILQTEDHEYWSEDYESEMYSYIQQKLAQLGFEQYEISNYARHGYQSIHNIHYWNRDEYYGVGLSASGMLGSNRYTNTYSLKDYISKVSNKKFPITQTEAITDEDVLFEQIMLGLRYYQFVTLSLDIIEYIQGNQFLNDKFEYAEMAVRLKPEYYYISNQIILDVLERIEC